MYPLRCLLAHPVSEIRQTLRDHCQRVAWLRVVGEAARANEALELAQNMAYNALFLAPGPMGECTGLELARLLKTMPLPPALLFVATTQDQALEAFELGALDYFLWPASTERLDQCLEKIRRTPPPPHAVQNTTAGNNAPRPAHKRETLRLDLGDDDEEHFVEALKATWSEPLATSAQRPDKLPVQSAGKTLLIPYVHIIFIAAEDDYCFVHTSSGKYLNASRLKNLEERLAQHRFFRIHRKYLVNLDMVTEVASMPGANLMLRTAGTPRIELPVSRRRIQELKSLLGL